MSFNKCRPLMKAFIEFHFNYCPLIWMFHSRIQNNKIDCIFETALRLLCSDHVSSFDELLKKDRSFSIHHRNIQSLAFELYTFFHGLSPSTMKNIFNLNTNIPYNLRPRNKRYSRNPKTVKYGTETISYLASKIWSLVPNVIKSCKIRQWEPDCSCRLCKNYLKNVGFIQFFFNYFFKSIRNIMCLIRFIPMLLSCFCVFRILAPYADISGINCKMNQSSECHSSFGSLWKHWGEKY